MIMASLVHSHLDLKSPKGAKRRNQGNDPSPETRNKKGEGVLVTRDTPGGVV